MDDGNGWLVTYTDLQALVAKLGLTVNPLGFTAGQAARPSDSLEQEWSQYSAGEQEMLRLALNNLSNPRQIMQLAWTIGEVAFQQSTLFWGSGANELVWLSQTGLQDQYQLQMVNTGELSLLLTDLVGGTSLSDNSSNQSLSAAALLALLGASELMRQRYHQSMLKHHNIEISFNSEQIQASIAEASQVDARWLLCFWEKTLPIDMAQLAAQVKDALPQLVHAGWLQPASAGLFQFTESGWLLVKEMLNEKAKLSVTIARTNGQEILLDETILLVRGPQDLWLYSLNGEQGGVGRIGHSGWQLLNEALLRPPLESEASAEPGPIADNQPKFCSKCGASIVSGGRFCRSCGKEI